MSYQENSIWPMQAFHPALELSYHIKEYITTSLNGAMQDFGLSYHYLSCFTANHKLDSPQMQKSFLTYAIPVLATSLKGYSES
jgi:hypothetical protein